MKNSTLARYAVLLAFVGAAGCANTETTGTVRRSGGESIDIGGVSYSSQDSQESSVFGTENIGLSSNPTTKPSASLLGDEGQYTDLELSIEPSENTAFINEIVEYTVTVKYTKKIAQEPQFVIILDKASGANGSLMVDDEYLISKYTPKDDQIVVTPKSGMIKFRVLTGTSYNNKNKPMYYVNVWHADDENAPLSSALYVKRPAQIGVDKISEGTKDVQNSMTVPQGIGSSKLKSATLVNVDSLDQQLYALYNKRIHVKLEGTCEDGGVAGPKGSCKLSDETICWNFVKTTKKNPGYVDEDLETQYQGGAQFENKGDSLGINSGCGKADENGRFWVNVYTGSAYNARYYLNFFHATAAPVTYRVDTFALPETLGEQGTSATIIDDSLAVDTSKAKENEDTGRKELKGCDATALIEKLDDATIKSIEKECGAIKDCNKFACVLSENNDGTWQLQKDGNAVLIDVDGDGNNDLVNIVVVQDANGGTYVNGIDTNGDGKVDVASDASKVDDSNKNANSFVCSTEKNGKYTACSRLTANIDETLPIYLKLKKGSSLKSGGTVTANLIYDSSFKSNNAAFDEENGPKTTTITAKDGVYTLKFWSGTAFNADYYIHLSEDDTKSVYLPVSVLNSLNMPTSEGDQADYHDATVPPGDIGAYIPDIGDVTIEVAPGYSAAITSPVIKTLDLKVVVKKDNAQKTLVPNTKTWWKVARGESIHNNGTLLANTALTSNTGMAVDQFYTGTGYNSVYYVSVFHPNYRDEDKKPIPFVFTITTANSTGSVAGPTGDPTVPEGDSTATDSSGNEVNCKEKDCSELELNTVNGEHVNPNYPQGGGCSEGIDGNTVTHGKQGCLLMTIVGDNSITAPTGATIPLKIRLIWKNGSEDIPIKGDIIWTLDKTEAADGELIGSKTQSNSNGEATIRFKTGSKDTQYKVHAYFPNIHDGQNMIPHTFFIAVKAIPDIAQPSELNSMKLSADASSMKKKGDIANVSYYVMSSYYNSCGDDFVFNKKAKRASACQALPKSIQNDNQCEIEADAGQKGNYATEVDISNTNDRFVVYAVANDSSGIPVGYGCEDMQIFTSAKTPASCDTDNPKEENHSWIYKYDKLGNKEIVDGKEVKICLPVRELNVKVPLGDVPMVIADTYKTKTLVNLGPLMKKGSEVDKSLDSVMEVYNRFIGPEPVDKIMTTLEEYVIFKKGSSIEKCAQLLGTKKISCEDVTRLAQCPGYTNDQDSPKSAFTGCGCVCASMYYWTAVNSIGEKVADLAKKGLKSLLKKYLNGDKLKDVVCSAFDGIQFATLTGDINWKKDGDKLLGSMKYSGAKIPFTSETIDLSASLVEGKWREAAISNATQLSISDYTLNFTYGEFIYSIVGKLIGGLNEKGEIKFAEIIKCDKIFGNVSLPIIGSISGLQGICEVGLATLGNYTATFAVNKYVGLSLTLQGSAEFAQGNDCIKAENGIGCKALNIEGGRWQGTGTLGEQKADGKDADNTINGIWIGYTDGQDEPAFKYGDKTADEFMAENSLCRKKMKEAEDGSNLTTNKACLGGYDNVAARASSNHCDKNNCKESKSIVVCDANGLVEKYKTATAAEIIKSANAYCKDNPSDASCASNAEIINGGKGITNAECLTACSSNKSCQDNPSIVVCSGSEALSATDLATLCKEVAGDDAKHTKCFEEKAQEACVGKCDEPGCVMNKEVAGNCKASSESTKPEPEPQVAADVIASWTFSKYVQNNKALDADLKGDVDGFKCDGSDSSCNNVTLAYKCGPYSPKVVAGRDSVLGAVGSQMVQEECSFTINLTDAQDAYNIKKVEFDVLGYDRVVHYTTDGGTPLGVIKTNDWHTESIDLTEATAEHNKETQKGLYVVKIWATVPGKEYTAVGTDYKMMRLDNVKVWATKKETSAATE